MFKVLYRCNRTIERHTNSPLADSRRRYLEHLAAGGASPSMMRNVAALMYRAVQLLDLEANRPVKRTEVERAAKGMGRPEPILMPARMAPTHRRGIFAMLSVRG